MFKVAMTSDIPKAVKAIPPSPAAPKPRAHPLSFPGKRLPSSICSYLLEKQIFKEG